MEKRQRATPTGSADRPAVVVENGAVVQAELEDVGTRIGPPIDLTGKGVHRGDPPMYEVHKCVVRIYLVVADVLPIRKRATQPDRPGAA